MQLEPDIKVPNDYKSVLSGKDPQLERAVKEMQDAIKKQKELLRPFKEAASKDHFSRDRPQRLKDTKF